MRRVFAIASVLSLLLCAASAVMWARLYVIHRVDYWDVSPTLRLVVHGPAIHIVRSVSATQHDVSTIPYGPIGWIAACFIAIRLNTLYRIRRQGHCDHCGYNLTGNTSGVCPECGTAVDRGNSARGSGAGS